MNNQLPRTLQEAIQYFTDDLTCIEFLTSLRWVDGAAICPACESDRTRFLATRKIYKCNACKKQFSVKVGTIFEDSAIKLDKWLVAVWLIANAKNGISSYEIHRAIGITQKSAWFVLHRIRTAMENGSFEPMTGIIEADETFVGGNPRNMHSQKRAEILHRRSMRSHKIAVLGILERKGRVRAKVVPNVRRVTVLPIIEDTVLPCSTIYTDEALQYELLRNRYVHETVNHCIEYVRDNVHTNSIENFWSLLKRTIKGTYISIQAEHLQKYVEEQCFRYNNRETNDLGRFLELLKSISGKKLTYKKLIGYERC